MKGTQRRVVHIKNTDNDFFEEAYLILKEGGEERKGGADFVKEANQFLSDEGAVKGKRGTFFPRFTKYVLLANVIAVAFLAALLLIRIIQY